MRTKLLLAIVFSVLAATWANPATAQDANAAKSLLTEAYTHYGKGDKGIDWSGPLAEKYFHPSLISRMRADARAAGTDNVSIAGEADHLCDCQDWDGIFDLKIDVKLDNPAVATADVSFDLADAKHRTADSWHKLKIVLTALNGQWRVNNVVSIPRIGTPFDLRSQMQREIYRYRKESKDNAEQ